MRESIDIAAPILPMEAEVQPAPAVSAKWLQSVFKGLQFLRNQGMNLNSQLRRPVSLGAALRGIDTSLKRRHL